MTGFTIFAHAIWDIVSEFRTACRLSAVPYAVSAVFALYVAVTEGLPPGHTEIAGVAGIPAAVPAQIGIAAVSALTSFALYLWVAVAWHRHVLLGETPQGWLPRLRPGAVLAYMWRAVVLILMIFVAAAIVAAPFGLIAALAGGVTGVVLFAVLGMGVGAWLFFRVCAVLPAAAIGRPMSMLDAWNATRGGGLTAAVLAALTVAGSLLLQLPVLLLGGEAGPLGLLYGLVLHWAFLLVGASLVTTFYRHHVARRPPL